MPRDALCFLLVHIGAIRMEYDPCMLQCLVGILCQIGMVDAGLQAPGLANLLRGPLAAFLLLDKSLAIHDKDALFFLCLAISHGSHFSPSSFYIPSSSPKN